MATVTSREFNHDVGAAKRTAAAEPVIITDRGEPAFVLLSIDTYRTLAGVKRTIVDLLRGADDGSPIEFEPPRLDITLRVPEL